MKLQGDFAEIIVEVFGMFGGNKKATVVFEISFKQELWRLWPLHLKGHSRYTDQGLDSTAVRLKKKHILSFELEKSLRNHDERVGSVQT